MKEQVDGADYDVGYSVGKKIKLKNRRVEVFQNERTKEWWLRYKRLNDDGTIGRQSIRLTDEAMGSTLFCIHKIIESS